MHWICESTLRFVSNRWRSLKFWVVEVVNRKRHKIHDQWGDGIDLLLVNFLGMAGWMATTTTSALSTGLEVSGKILIIGGAGLVALNKLYPAFCKPKNDPTFVEFKKRRRILTALCIENIDRLIHPGKAPTAADVQEIREELLTCIVQFFREYRKDLAGVIIFANLLEKEGNEIIVAVRSDETRKVGVRYPAASLLANEVFERNEICCCGNVEAITERSTRYKSFIALPVFDHEEGICRAVVTIDSTKYHHFDDVAEVVQ